MSKVLILIEADRHENCPHPEVGPVGLPEGWKVIPVDSNLFLSKKEKVWAKEWLTDVRDMVYFASGGSI